MLQHNPYVKEFHQAGRPLAQHYAAHIEAAAAQGVPLPDDVPDVVLKLMAPVGPPPKKRRYSLPTDQKEVGAFIPDSVLAGPDTGVPTSRYIKIKLTNGSLIHPPNISPYLDPLRFPLLFPTGAPGWGLNMPLRTPPHIPPDQHEAYWQRKKRDTSLATIYRVPPHVPRGAGFFKSTLLTLTEN